MIRAFAADRGRSFGVEARSHLSLFTPFLSSALSCLEQFVLTISRQYFDGVLLSCWPRTADVWCANVGPHCLAPKHSRGHDVLQPQGGNASTGGNSTDVRSAGGKEVVGVSDGGYATSSGVAFNLFSVFFIRSLYMLYL